VVFALLLAIVLAGYARSESTLGAADAQVSDDTQPPPLSLPALDDMKKVADNLETIKKALDVASPVVGSNSFKTDFDWLNQQANYTKDLLDLAIALRQDIAENRSPASPASHTHQQLAGIDLELMTDPDRLQDMAKFGWISEAAAQRLGFFSFGTSDIVEGAGTMAGQHSLGNVDAAEKVLDGISATAWGVYGFLSTGNWEIAQALAAASGVTAKGARALTLPMVEQITAKATGLDDKFVAIWEEAQKQRMRVGKPAENLEDFYHRDASVLDKIAPNKLSEANARLGLTTQFERRTVEHYRETCINGYCSRVDLLPRTVATEEHPIGGVRLDQPLTGAALRGVKIDEVNGKIVLLGEHDFLARGLNLRDFATALFLVFGPQPQDPAFSLDPDDVRNPRGPWMRARYMPDLLQGRSFGAEIFAADLRLKELSFQVMLDPNGKLKEWRSAVPGFYSLADLAMKDSSRNSGAEQWARFWIVPEQVTSCQAGHTLLFAARMAVKARRLTPDPYSPTGLRDIETDPSSLQARWAQLATERYDDLAKESPAWANVREMAVAMGIAKALKAGGAHVNLGGVADLLNADHTATVAKINAIAIGWQHRSSTPFREGDREGVRTETQELRLFGGVDLAVEPRAVPDVHGVAHGMDNAVETAFHSGGPGTNMVRFEYGGSRLEAVALPLLLKQ
jgi:hypothetical protein